MSNVQERHQVFVDASEWLAAERGLAVLVASHGSLAFSAIRFLIDGVIVATTDSYGLVPYPSELGKVAAITSDPVTSATRFQRPFEDLATPHLTAKWWGPNAFLYVHPSAPYELVGTKKAMRAVYAMIQDYQRGQAGG